MSRKQNSEQNSDSSEREISAEAASANNNNNNNKSTGGLAGFFGQGDYSFGVTPSTYNYLLTESAAPDVVSEQVKMIDSDPILRDASQVDAGSEPVRATSSGTGGFSENFKFKPTLLNIFWKIDSNHDQRLSKQELHIAIRHGKFHDDEELLAGLLMQHFDYIRTNKLRSSRFFDQRGLKVEEIMSYPWATFVPPESLPVQDPFASSTRLKPARRA
jgi:hypothetical protein